MDELLVRLAKVAETYEINNRPDLAAIVDAGIHRLEEVAQEQDKD